MLMQVALAAPAAAAAGPASGSFSLRLVKAVRSCPILVVKVNSRGPYLRSDNVAMGECESSTGGPKGGFVRAHGT